MGRSGVLAAAVLWAGSVVVGTTAHAETAVEKGKVFTGPEGIKVEVVPLKPSANKKVLLRFSGVGGPYDGKVLLHEVSEYDGKADFTTQYKGRGWNSLISRSGWWSAKGYTLFTPGSNHRDGISVSYDEAATKNLNSEEVAKNYELLQKAGELTELMNFSRKEYEADYGKSWAEHVKATNEKCGSTIDAKVDWKSVTDDLILKDNLSITGYCGASLDAIQRVCNDDTGKKAVKAGIKTVNCAFGKAANVTLDKGALSYTTAKDASNQEDFVHVFLEKKL